MAIYSQYATTPLPTDIPVKNYGSTDIPAGYAVILDTTNYIGGAAGQDTIGVKLPTAVGQYAIGVTMTTIVAGGSAGLLRPNGIAQCYCDGTVTVGEVVDPSGDSGDEGQVKTHVAGKAQIGVALTTGADLDPVLVLLSPAYNA